MWLPSTPTPLYLPGPCLVPVPLSLALGSSSVLSLGFLGDTQTFGVSLICLALHRKAEAASTLEMKACGNMRDLSLLVSLEPTAEKLTARGHGCKQTPQVPVISLFCCSP